MCDVFKKYKNIILLLSSIGIIIILYGIIESINSNNFIEFKEDFIIHLYISTIYFLFISLGSLLFLGIQIISRSGWSVIMFKIMSSISSFIPFGSIIFFIIIIFNLYNYINMFHWTNPNLYNKNSIQFDEIIYSKRLILNIPFFLIRNFFYLIVFNFFYKKIKNILKKFTIIHKKTYYIYNNIYKYSVYMVIFASISLVLSSWDWIMFLNPHWFSTLFGWYIINDVLILGISFITICSIFLSKIGYLSNFNENHLNDLGTYLFSGSLLWGYFWFSQYLLYWYGNIPEEIIYFITRAKFFYNMNYWIIIPNVVIPFVFLIKQNYKKNSKIMLFISTLILIGHYIDIYILIIPDVIKKFNFHFYNIGSLLFMISIFLYIILSNINYKKLNLIGYPFFKESKEYGK